MSADLARLLLGDPAAAVRPSPFIGGICTAWSWDGTNHTSTVVADGTTYTNLRALNPAAMSVGTVLLAIGPAGPIILGRLV